MISPFAHCEFHSEEPEKQPNGTPLYDDVAVMRSAEKGETRVESPAAYSRTIRASHNVGHHCSGTRASNKDSARRDAVVADGVLDHGCDALAVAAGIVLQRLGAVDIW